MASQARSNESPLHSYTNEAPAKMMEVLLVGYMQSHIHAGAPSIVTAEVSIQHACGLPDGL
jgi:hypothetical protein